MSFRKNLNLVELVKLFFSSVEEGYDLVAPRFDCTPLRTPDFILSSLAGHIGSPESIGSALDICCGTGVAVKILRPICRERVVGIDISQKLLDIARKNTIEVKGYASIEFVHCNVLDMSFDKEFDVAVCFGGLCHIPKEDKSGFIKRVYSALKPGGRFIFFTYNTPRIWSARYWLYFGINTAARIRNLFMRTKFTFNKLSFVLPNVKTFLESYGFCVEVKECVFGDNMKFLKLIIATRIS